MKYKHEITVAGEKLSLCSEDKPEYVAKLASELSKMIGTTMLSGAEVTKLDAAIVCALDLLNENKRLKAIIEDNR
ncbi:MAG: cell division protein ZapA [Clostridia bacterium]|nr:cell division protein ZapA [Clostridia bacterium]